MVAMTSQITSLMIVESAVYQAQIKENITAPHHWPLCREFTGHKGPAAPKMFPFDDIIMSVSVSIAIWVEKYGLE